MDHHYGGKEARLSEVAANNFQTRLLRRFSRANAPLLFITDPSLPLNRVRLTFHRVFAILSFIERAIRDEKGSGRGFPPVNRERVWCNIAQESAGHDVTV